MRTINENPVFNDLAFIGGAFQASATSSTFMVMNPFDGSVIARVSDCGADDAVRAVEVAHKAFSSWRNTPAGERSRLLKKWNALILKYQEELAVLLTLEQGKPLAESRAEIAYGASFVEWFAEEAKRVYGDVIPAAGPDRRLLVIKQPVGVVSAITPWNFPNAMIARKVAPALAAGCTVVVKPSQKTPLSALALAFLAQKAGFPPGVVNVLPGSDARTLGRLLASHHLVRKVSFTGSTRIGKDLLQLSANTVKKVSMELGGNAPFIVFDDADPDEAVKGLMASKFRNAGQTCVCSNRIFVQEGVYDVFMKKLERAMRSLVTGDGMDEKTTVGPLISEKAMEFTESLVKDAVNRGASIICGGARSGRLNYTPVLLKDATPDMALFHEEIFAPVAPVFRFSNEDEVVRLANDTIYGLASYFYGKDHSRIWRVAEALDFGMVGINTGVISAAEAPFGGIKQSGFGREGSRYGMDEYLEIKYLNWAL